MPCSQVLTHCTRCAAKLLWVVLGLCAGSAWAQTAPAYKLRVVGGLAGIHQYTRQEEPFWTQTLPRVSGGKFSADIVPFDRAGVAADDMLRLIQLGVVPLGTALMSSLSAQYPEYTAPDLAGLNPDLTSLKKSVAAFRPYLESSLRARQGIEVLALYIYPAQVLFCKNPITRLSDLAGRRVRVAAATQADFVAALGGVPVLTSFAQIMSNMASGNTECAITGSMTGNTMGLHRVTSHVFTLPITWGVAIFGANLAAWDALDPELKSLLRRELTKLEAAIWAESEQETMQGLACNTGARICAGASTGHMLATGVSAQDEQRRQEVLRSAVLPRWLQRCHGRCNEVWNRSIGPAVGVLVPAAP